MNNYPLNYSEGWICTNYSEDNLYERLYNKYVYDLDIYDDVKSQKEGNENMEKKFIVATTKDWTGYATEEAAVDIAKRYTSKNQQPYFVFQAITKVESPAPEAVVTKL